MKYIIHWKDGKDEIIEGLTIETALIGAGYGAGAICALCWETWYPEYKGSEEEE